MKYFFILFILISTMVKSQIIPSYNQDFDSINLTGWSQYNTAGSNWERGVSTGKNYLTAAYSLPNAFYTELNGFVAPNTLCYLQTPAFDLSNTSIIYYLSFRQRRGFNSSSTSGVQYSLNNGVTWTTLNNAASNKINWSITGTSNHNFYFSAHSLDFLSGQSNVIFRFYFSNNSATNLDGWMIDNFYIGEEYFYLNANNGTPFKNVSKFTTQLTVSSNITVNSPYGLAPGSQTTRFYYSNDSILDASDTLMLEQTFSSTSFSYAVPLPTNLINAGKHYIIHQHDVYNDIIETNENFHIGFTRIEVDSTYPTPYKEDFEGNNSWKKFSHNAIGGGISPLNNWKVKESNIGSEEIFDGNKSLHHDQFEVDFNAIYEFIQSPFIDLNTTQPNSLCYWYKLDNRMVDNSIYGVKFGLGISSTSYPYYTFTPTGTNNVATTTPRMERLWDCKCVSLGSQEFMKFHFYLATNAYFNPYLSFLSYDRIYVGKSLPDLTIENKTIQLTTSNTSLDTLHYMIFNGGGDTIPSTVTKFYWSIDSLFDASDIYLGAKTESAFLPNGVFSSSGVDYMYTTFEYTKPVQTPGIYYVIHHLDADSLYEESWEDNNISYFKISQQFIPTLPYENDFEVQTDGWYHEMFRYDNRWDWGPPNGPTVTSAFSGSKGFHTNKPGTNDSTSKFDLYTPPFDLSQLNNPVMEFDLDLINEAGYMPNWDCMNLNYSTDGGKTWRVLDTAEYFKRWNIDYEYDDYYGFDGLSTYNTYYSNFFKTNEEERTFMSNKFYDGRDTRNLTRFCISLHKLGDSTVWFRFNYVHHKGNQNEAFFDNFKISEATPNLTIDYRQKIFADVNTPHNQYLEFSVLNNGSTKSPVVPLSLYLSNDSIFDAGDVLTNTISIPEILPYRLTSMKLFWPIPAVTNSPNYLIYVIDPNNVVNEINENDNNIPWEVNPPITQFPYEESFSDIYPEGWFYKLSNSNYDMRIGTISPPNDTSTRKPVSRGYAYADYLNSVATSTPAVYSYYSPVFDFTNYNDTWMTFDLFSYGENNCEKGGNIEYTTDNGITWNVLNNIFVQSYNWYNCTNISGLGNKPGWRNSDNTATPDSVGIDVSNFLSNSSVQFKFSYFGRGFNPSGSYRPPFKLDNFRLNDMNSDLEAMNQGTIMTNQSAFGYLHPLVTVQNNSLFTSTDYEIGFWWSTDANFDPINDEFSYSFTASAINSQGQYVHAYPIAPPQNVQIGTYYLFYMVDKDSATREINEANNVGYFIVDFSSSVGIEELSNSLNMYYTSDKVIINSEVNLESTFKLIDGIGKCVFEKEINVQLGENIIQVPLNIAPGLYFATLNDSKNHLIKTVKIIKD